MSRIILAWAILVPAVAAAETRKLPITADVGICAHPSEAELNTGGNPRIRIKGNIHYYLFNFDAAPVKNWQITKATLHLKLAGGRPRRMAVCTVPVEWVEGTGRNAPVKNATCFLRRRPPEAEKAVPWTPGGGTIIDATFNSPHMLWRASDVTIGSDRWMTVPLDPRLVQAVAVGLSQGLIMGEEKGQTQLFENHDIFTREQGGAQPYVTVEGQAVHVAAPSAVARPKPKVTAFPAASDFVSGGMLVDVSWAGKDVLGSRVWVSQMIGTVGMRVQQRVTFMDEPLVLEKLIPVDEKVNGWKWSVRVETYIGPQGYSCFGGWQEQSRPLAVPKVTPGKAPQTMKRVTVGLDGWRVELHPAAAKIAADAAPTLDVGATMPVPVTARNAWLGVQAVLFPWGQAKDVGFHYGPVKYVGRRNSSAGDISKPVPPRMFRTWYVRKGEEWHAETLVPYAASAAQDIPWQLNGVPGQKCLPFFLDLWVPGHAQPGPYELDLIVQVGSKVVARPKLRFRVAAVVLPDTFHIAGDMNTYNSPARAMGLKHAEAEAFMEMERKYYRLAHSHRMTLDVLPYSQSGLLNWRGAPKVAGRGEDCRVSDWSEWDGRYDPLLSGEAFSDRHGYVGPGAGVAIRHMYLPFHENWPSALAGHFKPWTAPKDYNEFCRWAADLPPIEKCIDKDFADAWTAVYRQFRDHLEAKKWVSTRYQIYLNNKYYFRDRSKGYGRGISLWLLDEPMFADDFLALRYFGRLTRKAETAVAKVGRGVGFRCDFRVDISRPTHQRTWLDGLVDLNVCADQLYSQRRLIRRRRRTLGEEYWNYRMPASFGADNEGWTVWPVRSYCWGATGTLPWQTIGSDGDLAKADPTALMYPGRRFGLDEPVPSLRMKAWRDGLQTAELLRMLRVARKWNHLQLRAWVGQVCGLAGWEAGMDPAEDAGIVTFTGLDWRGVDRLRRSAIRELTKN